MTVNYIREINAFMAFCLDNEPSGNAQLLWHALMHLANTQGEGAEWPEEIRVSNRKLLLLLPYGEDTLARAREELAALGRIRCRPGSRGERPCYTLVYFCAVQAEEPEEQEAADESCPIPFGNGGGQDVSCPIPFGNGGGHDVCPVFTPQDNPQISGQTAELSQTNIYIHSGEDEEDRARARAAAELREEWPYAFGAAPMTPLACQWLAAMTVAARMEPGVLREAVQEAGRRCAREPAAYIRELLDDWRSQGVRTTEDLAELLIRRGRRKGWTGCLEVAR